jgi:hypothetical protein
VNSTWTVSQVTTGSFGAKTETIVWRALGERDWQGHRVVALQSAQSTWLFDAEKRVVAQLQGEKAVASYDPGESLYSWPLQVGKSHTAKYRYLNHANAQAVDVEFAVKVEAIERVQTPAGTFEVFRISMTSPTAILTRWYSPALGILVKDRFERLPGNRQGAGTRETILVSQKIAP